MTKISAYGKNVTNYLHKTKWSFPLHVIRSSGTGSLDKIEIPVIGILILPRLPVPLPLPRLPGADPGFFLRGGALVSCSTSTPINHIVFVFAEYQLH